MPGDRRRFLRYAFELGLAATLSPSLGRAVAGVPAAVASGRLQALRDPNSGRELLRLPAGFRYFSFGWAGTPLRGGGRVPRAADGMGVVASQGNRITLVRNHEVGDTTGAFARSKDAYDPACGGGCLRLTLDLAREKLVEVEPGLTGTLVNCAGGTTPWGSWLSCEEIVANPRSAGIGRVLLGRGPLLRPHGLVFEVAGTGSMQPRPIEAMGQFRHEAAAVDASGAAVYLTEDREPESGFYRFLPRTPGNLHGGGELQMLSARGAPDLRGGQRVGQRWTVSWVTIAEPMRGHSPDTSDSGGVVMQGIAGGATRFARLEGCLVRSDGIWFSSTSGGAAARGQIWRLASGGDELELMFEAGLGNDLDYPDNLCSGPGPTPGAREGMVICEDNQRLPNERLRWLGRDGRLLTIAENITRIGDVDYGLSEWAGCCVSPDGRWLFANVYSPGFSVAITGPWEELLGSVVSHE